ncbi:hypothetical protein CN354_20805 [Bacillus cereus]|nr:hypothetical protein CN354_20805 [Bacillus cereus]
MSDIADAKLTAVMDADTRRFDLGIRHIEERLERLNRWDGSNMFDGATSAVIRFSQQFDDSMQHSQDSLDRFGDHSRRTLDDMENDWNSRRFRINPDMGNFGGGGGGGMGLIGAILTLLPAAVPIIAAASAGAMALGASFLAAGAGVAGFAAVAIPTLTNVVQKYGEVKKAEEAVANASNAKERAKALKELEAAYEGVTEKQKETMAAMKDFGSFWSEFTGKFEEPILNTFISSMGTAKTILTAFEPAIQSTINGVDRLFQSFNQTLQPDDMKAFFDWLGNNAGNSLVALSTAVGNVFRGLINMFMAFTPLMKEMETGLVGM